MLIYGKLASSVETIVVKDKATSNKNVEKKENDKNRSKVLTQGDKLNIIKANPAKSSSRGKFKKARWSNECLKTLIQSF